MQKQLSLAIVIAAHNEEKNVRDVIESAKLLTEKIYLIDIESEDRTASLAKKAGAIVLTLPFTPYVEPTRDHSLQVANAEWVLILDADERINKGLTAEIKQILKQIRDDDVTHFEIPRKNIFGGQKWLRYGGWWPDYQIRLIKKSAFKTWPRTIHSTPQVAGKKGRLTQPLIHYFHGDFQTMVNKTVIFEDVESELLFKAKMAVTTATFIRKYLGELWRRLVVHAGFMDGAIGIIEAVYQAFSKTITYLYLYEKKESRTL